MPNLDSVVSKWKRGEKSKMDACIDLYALQPGDLGTVAKRLKASLRTVGRMLSAGMMYRIICEKFEDEAESLYNNLYYSHWATVGESLEKELIDPDEALGYLKQVVEEEWSVDYLRAKVPHLETAIDLLDYSHKKADELEYNIANGHRFNAPEPWASRVVRITKLFIKIVREHGNYT